MAALNQAYANGLSLWQHKVCKRYAKNSLGRADVEALAEAKQTIQELIAKDLFNKKLKFRSKAKRFASSSKQKKQTSSEITDNNLDVDQTIQPVVTTRLEDTSGSIAHTQLKAIIEDRSGRVSVEVDNHE